MVDDFYLNMFTEAFVNIKKEWLYTDDRVWNMMKGWVYEEIKEEVLKDIFEEVKNRIPEEKARSRGIPAKIRYTVYLRDNGSCVLCGDDENIEFDHIIPFSKGGAHSIENVRVLCRKCNRSRGNNMGWENG